MRTEYLKLLDAEIALWGRELGSRPLVSQLHLGGGTPTFLSDAELSQLVGRLREFMTENAMIVSAVDEGAALIQLEQLDQRSRILELGFERIDLRDPTVVAVRPRDGVLPGQLVANGA